MPRTTMTTILTTRYRWRCRRNVALALATGLVLGACGGGGGGGSTTASSGGADPGAVPASAFDSAQAMTAFVGALPPDDTQEPLLMGSAATPVSDADEPVPL